VAVADTQQLILFTRYPEAGVTKTRLIPALGPDGAADLQRRMTSRVMARALRLARRQPAAIVVRFEGGSVERMQAWLGRTHAYRPQGAGDIGERMRRALQAAFDDGVDRAVLIGSDIPGITAELLGEAFDSLHRADLVLGPARDGGYYLIGVRRTAWDDASQEIFAGVPWGTGGVLAATRRKIEALGLRMVLLGTLADIDRPEDLAQWKRRHP
jgi:rSAM/selenodomain-associated transferase 1